MRKVSDYQTINLSNHLTNMSLSHLYLFVGASEQTREQTKKILNSLSIDFDKSTLDLMLISPTNSIGIDQVRTIRKFIFQKPIKNKHKIVVVEQAEKLTQAAQNALLKTLEEPPDYSVIFLETNNKKALLETIISRSRVKIIPQQQSKTASSKTRNLEALLLEIGQTEDAKLWLKKEILARYFELLDSIAQQNHQETQFAQTALSASASAKAMIDANVNPKFALFNLLFKLRGL